MTERKKEREGKGRTARLFAKFSGFREIVASNICITKGENVAGESLSDNVTIETRFTKRTRTRSGAARRRDKRTILLSRSRRWFAIYERDETTNYIRCGRLRGLNCAFRRRGKKKYNCVNEQRVFFPLSLFFEIALTFLLVSLKLRF